MSETLSNQEIAAGLRKLRTDFRTAAIAHFSVLFLHHLGGTFNTSDFELDLLGVKPDAQIPALLGKILNTLANDRNTNSSNWLSALRRSYNRRVGREDNPFYSWHRVPGSVVEAERAIERAREEAEYEAFMAAKAASGSASGAGEGAAPSADVKKEDDEPVEKSIFADAEDKLRQAEKALYRKAGKEKAGTPFALDGSSGDAPDASRVKEEEQAAKTDGSLVREAGAADVNFSGKTAEAGVPVTEAALDDGFNAEMADVIAQDAAEGAFQEQQVDAEAGAKEEGDDGEEEEEWYEEQRAVDWKDLSLETKLDAIYNVCEWHMVDPAQQFRKYLQWDGEAAWRLDPIGTDSEGNKFFHTADDRLWIQREPPAADPSNTSDQPVRKPRTLLGLRAGPRDKSKKGTVTGVVRFKLKKNAETGAFEQVAEDEEGAAAGPSSAAGVKGEEGDEDAKMAASDPVKGEDDEASNLGSPALASSKKLADEPAPVEQEMPSWEKQYWEERRRADNTPGFVEWEAVCTTLDDWRAFPERFAKSTHPDEIKLRELVALELIPAVEQGIADEKQRREEERLAEEAKSAELAAQLSKRSSSRVAGVDEDGNPINDRPTRAARQQVRSYADDGLSEFVPAGSDSGTPKLESREDRLRKREEEKKRHEEEEERKLMEELREQERQEAMAKNNGVLPYELMNDDERAEYERQQEKERKRVEAEEKKRAKDEAKRARARERRAERKAERDAEAAADAEAEAAIAPPPPAPVLPIPPADAGADESWYLDCEICGTAGWNYDDGLALICCDSCEDWQHLPCHQQADALAGRVIPYEDEEFKWICGHCKGTRQRRPRPPKPPAGSPPQLVYPPHPLEPVTGQKRKSSIGAKSATSQQAAAKKPKAAKSNGQSIPYGHGGHPLYHPSAYQHPQAVQSPTYTSASPTGSTPAPAPAAQTAQQQQNASMSYEELKGAIEANPALMAQLPQDYQVHFSQLLGLPLPS